MTTLSKEDVVQLIEELGAGSNWLSGKYNVYSYNRQPKIAAMFLKAFAEQGLLELIAELRKPHDWKIEGFGNFKDVKMHQSDAPFRAASALEHFTTLARADLVAENERLKREVIGLDDVARSNLTHWNEVAATCVELRDQLTAARTALAAAEADNERLRKSLFNLTEDVQPRKDLPTDKWGEIDVVCSEFEDALKVIAQPRDDSALREMIAGVYEECAKVCEDDAKGWTDYSCEMAARDCADAIRALAEKAKGE